MTYAQILRNNIYQIDLLLHYLPHSETSIQRDSIMEEVNHLRRRVTAIEEMTKTEKQREAKTIKIIAESRL